MLNALPEPVRNTLCGPRRASAERAIARPWQKPDQGAQQPRPQPPTPDAAKHAPHRRLSGRHRQLAALGTPRPGVGKRLAPPLPPAPERDQWDPTLAPDRLHTRACARHQRADHHEQRRHAKTPAEKTCRGRCHPTPAAATAKAQPPSIGSQLRRQAVGLARIARAVKCPPTMRTPRRAAQRRLGLVNVLQKRPHTGVGKDGIGEKSVRHWGPSLEICSSPEDKPPGVLIASSSGGTNPQTSPNASGSAPDPRPKPASSQAPSRSPPTACSSTGRRSSIATPP